jgi:hypothetical protein
MEEYARRHPNVRSVALYSLARAAPFYQRLGFQRRHDAVKAGEQDDILFPGQVYMEMPLSKCGGQRVQERYLGA